MYQSYEIPLMWDHENGWYMAVCPYCCRMVVFGHEETRCKHWEVTHIADEADPEERSFMAFWETA